MNGALSAVLTVFVCSQVPVAARHQTANFVVYAETPEVAKLVAESAENHRKDLAKAWHGKNLRDWSTPCRINVTITMGRTHAFTEMSYAKGKVVAHQIEIKGTLDHILKGPLPHELTHVLLGHHFGRQAPRWADEGAAILSEDESQGAAQRKTFNKILAAEKHYPLRAFFAMKEYPADMQCLYAQGHSVSRFLVAAKGRQTFLAFVSDGLRIGWDDAVRRKYGYKNVEDLETAWLESQSAAELAPSGASSAGK
jgi:hypothetical protein